MKRSPSASSAKKRPPRSSEPRWGRGTKTTTSAAEKRKLAASSHSAAFAPKAATRTPPSGAPISCAPCWMPARMPRRPLHAARPASLDDVGEQRRSCRGARCVEERADEDEHHQLPDLDPDGRCEQRDRRDGSRAREVGDDARRAEPEPVDDDAAEEGREHDREEVEEDDERGERRAPRRRQDVPGDRDLRDRIPGERDRVGRVQRVERSAPHTASTLRAESSRTAQSSGRMSLATAAGRCRLELARRTLAPRPEPPRDSPASACREISACERVEVGQAPRPGLRPSPRTRSGAGGPAPTGSSPPGTRRR